VPPALPFPDDGLQAERRAIEATGGSGSGGGGGGVVGSDGGGSSGDGGGVVFQGHHRKNTVERLYDITRLRPLFFSLHHVFPSACPDIPLWHGTGLHAFLSSSTSSCAPSCVCRSGTTPDVLYVILLPPCACLHVRYATPRRSTSARSAKAPKAPHSCAPVTSFASSPRSRLPPTRLMDNKAAWLHFASLPTVDTCIQQRPHLVVYHSKVSTSPVNDRSKLQHCQLHVTEVAKLTPLICSFASRSQRRGCSAPF